MLKGEKRCSFLNQTIFVENQTSQPLQTAQDISRVQDTFNNPVARQTVPHTKSEFNLTDVCFAPIKINLRL